MTRTMRRRRAVRLGTLLAALLAVVVGCHPSENPIWTPETLVYYPELLGVYESDQGRETKTTTLAKGDAEKSYRVIERNAQGEKRLEATLRLVKLGDLIFYDYELSGVKPDDFDPPIKGYHIFGRLEVKDKKVRLYGFKGGLDGPGRKTVKNKKDGETYKLV